MNYIEIRAKLWSDTYFNSRYPNSADKIIEANEAVDGFDKKFTHTYEPEYLEPIVPDGKPAIKL